MLCDKCGYNLTKGYKCPNCSHDNSSTDYTPYTVESVEGNLYLGEPVLTEEQKAKRPFKKRCKELYDYTAISIFDNVVSFILTNLIFLFSAHSFQSYRSFFIMLIYANVYFILVDLICVILLSRGKEWMLAFYIPFSIISLPLMIISSIPFCLMNFFKYYRPVTLIKNRFFIEDYKRYKARVNKEKLKSK